MRAIPWKALGGLLAAAATASAAHARPLTPAESAILEHRNAGPAQSEAAQALVERLGLEQDLDVVATLLPLNDTAMDPMLVDRYYAGFEHSNPAPAVRQQMEQLALRVVQDPQLLTRPLPPVSGIGMFLHRATRHPSREAWRLYYDVIRNAALRWGRTPPPTTVNWALTDILTTRDLPGIEAPITQLLPLLRDGCQGARLIEFLGSRHYAPAFAALRDLELRSADEIACTMPLTTALEALDMRAATALVAQQLRQLIAQAGADRRRVQHDNDEITRLVGSGPGNHDLARVGALQADTEAIRRRGANPAGIDWLLSDLGAVPVEAQIDYVAYRQDILSLPLEPALRAHLEPKLDRLIDQAQQARTYTTANLLRWIGQGRLALVASFLQHGVPLDTPGPGAARPMCAAILSGNLELLQVFMDAGVDIDRSAGTPGTPGSRCLPLGLARRPEIAALLLAHGARVDAADESGQTALHWAAVHGDVAMLALLLAHGANANAAASHGYDAMMAGSTPLHAAVRFGAPLEAVRLLLDHRADPNARTTLGLTPIMFAVMGHAESTHSRDFLRDNPQPFAQARNMANVERALGRNAGLVRLLIERGGDPTLGARASRDRPDWYLATPVIVAHEQGDPEMEDLLREHGAHLNYPALAVRKAIQAGLRLLYGFMAPSH